MKNYPYPKNSAEFFARAYSIEQIEKNYDYPTLLGYLSDGYQLLENVNTILNYGLYSELGLSRERVERDKDYFTVRMHVIKTAIKRMSAMEVFELNGGLTLVCTN
jgi:hypothetical protein